MCYVVGMPVDRFSITMDPELGKAVREAAEAEGMSVSAWVARAAEDRVRLKLLAEYFEEWEAEHGAITEDEMAAADEFMRDVEREIREKKRRRGSAA